MIRLATDVGGTFTDLVGFDEATGRIMTAKSLTTPHRQSQGVTDVIGEAEAGHGLDPVAVAFFVHGGTTVINAVIERKGVRTALVTTRGFRDVLEIGRGNRPDLYNLRAKTPDPYVPRALRFEVSERIAADGRIVRPLTEEELPAIAAACRAKGVEAIAIAFLHSYRNPEHEQRCASTLRSLLPGISVCASHEVSREWREYERTNTAVLNAYVQPIAARYLDELAIELRRERFRDPFYVMQSHGGVARFDQTIARPLMLIESGPAGGVAGAVRIGNTLGLDDVLYLDVGGTTAKCCLIRGGRPEILPLYRIKRSRTSPGHAVQVPVVDIVEIGAGGGSVIRADAAGRLRVGPDSAGADPGPICYDLGGREPTLTDAAAVLGYLDPVQFAGGQMRLNADAARRGLQELGRKIGRSAEQAAYDAWQIALANMMSALKLVTVERGHDPRRLSLIVSGGAGPLFAAELGATLQCRQTIIPPLSGNFSAWGMLAAPPRFHLRRSMFAPLSDQSLSLIEADFQSVTAEAQTYLGHSPDRPGNALKLSRFLAMRYAGQEHSVEVPIDGATSAAEIAHLFHAAHERAYSFAIRDGKIEITNLTLQAEAEVRLVGFPISEPAKTDSKTASRPHRNVYSSLAHAGSRREGAWSLWPVFERDNLPANKTLSGPLLIEESGCTTAVHPGLLATMNPDGILSIVAQGK